VTTTRVQRKSIVHNSCSSLRTFGARTRSTPAINRRSPGVGVTYSLTYNGNGNSGGAVPVDPTHYTGLQLVTVVGNSGSLVRTGDAFVSWNSKPDGSGKAWAVH